MAGVKGRSGPKKGSKTPTKRRNIELMEVVQISKRVAKTFFNNPDISIQEKMPHAVRILGYYMPKNLHIEGKMEVRSVADMVKQVADAQIEESNNQNNDIPQIIDVEIEKEKDVA